MHRPRRHFNTIQSRAPDQVADQVTDGGVGLESGGLTEGSSYLVDGGVVDSLASKNILTTDEHGCKIKFTHIYRLCVE